MTEPAPYSRAAWESWQDIFWAHKAGLIEPFLAAWCCPNNPWVIIVRKEKL